MKEFFNALNHFAPTEGRVMYCQFRGDPNDDTPGKWRAKVLNNPDAVDSDANLYVCVSAMKRNQHGEFRRRKENFAGGLCLMIDDLGTGLGAKQPMSTIERLQPTALIETSPDNYQAIYMFDRLETDMLKFEALIRAFVHNCLLTAANSGMEGVNRVFRPPAGINGKGKYKKEGQVWRVRLAEWHPENRYSIDRIAAAFGLSLVKENRMPPDPSIMNSNKGELIRAYVEAKRVLRYADMLKREEPNRSGWIDIQCPWTENHTDQADNGASIREPDADNGWSGAFRCHHGGCAEKHWRDLTDYINDGVVEMCDSANRNAKEMTDYAWERQK